MRILFLPQRADKSINYHFEKDKVIADGKVFDFSQELPKIEFPLIQAEDVNGVIHLQFINYHGPDATMEERFPDWIEI